MKQNQIQSFIGIVDPFQSMSPADMRCIHSNVNNLLHLYGRHSIRSTFISRNITTEAFIIETLRQKWGLLPSHVPSHVTSHVTSNTPMPRA